MVITILRSTTMAVKEIGWGNLCIWLHQHNWLGQSYPLPCLDYYFKIELRAKWNISGNNIWCSSSLHTEWFSVPTSYSWGGKCATCSHARLGSCFGGSGRDRSGARGPIAPSQPVMKYKLESAKIPGRFQTSDFRIKWIKWISLHVKFWNKQILWYGDTQILHDVFLLPYLPSKVEASNHPPWDFPEAVEQVENLVFQLSCEAMANMKEVEGITSVEAVGCTSRFCFNKILTRRFCQNLIWRGWTRVSQQFPVNSSILAPTWALPTRRSTWDMTAY